MNVKEDLVVCDVSLNNNYKVDGTTFTEPTLSIRYKFVIRPASEIANRIKDSKADETTPFMDETIYVPQNNGTINIQLGRIANNYAWYDGDQIVQGETYQYKKDNGEWKDLGNRWTQIINNLKFGRWVKIRRKRVLCWCDIILSLVIMVSCYRKSKKKILTQGVIRITIRSFMKE